MRRRLFKVKLAPGETMHQRREKDRLDRDVTAVHRAIRNNPGIAGKKAIAAETGLSPSRVALVVKKIQAGETEVPRVDYGTVTSHGQLATGWYSMVSKRHHAILNQADEHGSKVEIGVRRSRLVRLAQTKGGLSGSAAAAAITAIEARLEVQVELLSQTDVDTFEEILLEEISTDDDD